MVIFTVLVKKKKKLLIIKFYWRRVKVELTVCSAIDLGGFPLFLYDLYRKQTFDMSTRSCCI